ncbi:MAG: amino acid--[acyl-carrier-protein] ligase [Kofleriaceae bacterium]|nr:amino acid--[acyl-carrier-protein] ligase [Myxococcales bacterium]MCB9565292.1 amino acid--[acyl-carrier-protein] ligase [Kofleriaceae bacterium]
MTTEYDPQRFYEGLVDHKLIVPVRVQGAFGRGAVFEDVLERVNALVSKLSVDDGAELYTFPPVIDRTIIERTDYLDSFPHLAGTVFSFFGKERQAKELSDKVHAGQPWGDLQGMTDVCLNPAACYPLYPTMSGQLPDGGRLVTMTNWVFRHEPSPEPTRMQSFRVREFVRAGTPDDVVAWRDMWLQRGVDMLTGLGLPARPDVAADPFFGRAGRILADGQKAQKLKFEVLVPVISEEHPTAVCSFNYHQDHFGTVFDIRTSAAEVAHTACLGFGLERVVMALFRHHGFVPAEWPQAVRDRLWP